MTADMANTLTHDQARQILADNHIPEETFLSENIGHPVYLLPDESAVGLFPNGTIQRDNMNGDSEDVRSVYDLETAIGGREVAR